MSGAVAEALKAEDTLYDELYDVRTEAEQIGNYIDVDPYPLMNAARERGSVQKGFLREVLGLPMYHRNWNAFQGRQGYAVLTFAEAEAAFRDNLRLSNHVYKLNDTGENVLGILEMDNPEHFAYRRAAQSLFIKPRAVGMWRDRWINEIVKALVENLHGRDGAELNMLFCARLPVHTITIAVGLHGDDALVFRKALLESLGGTFGPEKQMQGRITVERMVGEQIAKRRDAPGEDIISWLVAAEIDLPGESKRPLHDKEIVTFCRLLLTAGGGTTWRQLGIFVMALLEDRERWETVRAERRLLEPAIQESLRWCPTNPMFSRLALEDVTIGGVDIPAGSAVDICLGSANRDPARWENPDVFDVHRPFKQHIGFGIGAHMCLGRNVAESEMYVAVDALMDRFPDIWLDPDHAPPYITGGFEQRGVSALHVRLR